MVSIAPLWKHTKAVVVGKQYLEYLEVAVGIPWMKHLTLLLCSDPLYQSLLSNLGMSLLALGFPIPQNCTPLQLQRMHARHKHYHSYR